MNSKFRKLEEPTAVDDPPGDSSSKASGQTAAPQKADIFPPAMSVPKLRFELDQLYRDRKIHEADLLLLMQRLEVAKVNEARDTSAFQILDSPPMPTYKSRPRRARALASGLILGLLAGLVWVFGPSSLRALWQPAKPQSQA
jgi:uncharacterized protein involved in exopolysaccharide biosynthesis